MTCKIVSAPLNIKDMDNDLESNTVYIFDYNNSLIKNDDFLTYISNSGIIADVLLENQSIDTKSSLLKSYIYSSTFYHLSSFNASLLNIVYYSQNINIRVKYGFVTDDDIKLLLEDNTIKNIVQMLIEHYSSLFHLTFNIVKESKLLEEMINMSKIKLNYNKQITDNNIYPNIYSILLDPFFYDYFTNGVSLVIKNYYSDYYEKCLYDHKPLSSLLINDYNTIFKILYDTFYNQDFQKFLKTNHPQMNLNL